MPLLYIASPPIGPWSVRVTSPATGSLVTSRRAPAEASEWTAGPVLEIHPRRPPDSQERAILCRNPQEVRSWRFGYEQLLPRHLKRDSNGRQHDPGRPHPEVSSIRLCPGSGLGSDGHGFALVGEAMPSPNSHQWTRFRGAPPTRDHVIELISTMCERIELLKSEPLGKA